jgi:hypothetical protein
MVSMRNTLPGMDVNDFPKTLATTYQFVSIFSNLAEDSDKENGNTQILTKKKELKMGLDIEMEEGYSTGNRISNSQRSSYSL